MIYLKKILLIGGGIVLVLAVIGASGAGSVTQKANDGTSSTSATPAQQAVDPNPHFSDGVFEIGKDIQPGTYRTRVGSSGCYYARLSGFGNTLSEIIANENTDSPAIVSISTSDKGFKSSRCGTWTQDLSQITTSKTSFGDGIYIVGTDIQPGKYKNTGQSGCYYSRLSGYGGTLSDIISNENTDAVAIVAISPTDKGFKSSRCGTWNTQ